MNTTSSTNDDSDNIGYTIRVIFPHCLRIKKHSDTQTESISKSKYHERNADRDKQGNREIAGVYPNKIFNDFPPKLYKLGNRLNKLLLQSITKNINHPYIYNQFCLKDWKNII